MSKIARAIRFDSDDQVVTVWAEPASGPGWSNQPTWVLIRTIDGRLRIECIQPEEMTNEMHVMYPISAVAHATMTRAVKREVGDRV